MPSHRKGLSPLRALLLALMILPPIAIVASVSWMKHQPQGLVFLLSGLASALAVASSFALAILYDRQIDEWQRSNARFSSQWGWTAGACLIALLMALPPFRDLVVSMVASWAGAPTVGQKPVLLAFTLGFGTVVFAQGLCTVLLSIGWVVWKSRAARDPA